MMTPKYLHRSNDRSFPGNYQGPVLIWDIDKTYLETRFSSARSLARIPFELAVDKLTVPGAVPLLRALRRGPGPGSAVVPLYFVSGSPLQIRSVIQRKMDLDGVGYDGLTFKDQLGLFLRGRGGYIRQQVGYKLRALLLYRRELPDGARYLLFGDDSESDAEVFALFGRVCGGLRGEALDRALPPGVADWEREEIRTLTRDLPVGDNPVDGIFIHLAKADDPERLKALGAHPTQSYLQTAMVLAHQGRVAPEAITAVAKMLRRRLISEAQIGEWADDAQTRFELPETLAARARD